MLTIEVSELSKSYRKFAALTDASIEVGPGVTCLLGRNGAGKSTLVRHIVGLERAGAGTVSFVGSAGPIPETERNAHLGWLPQSFGFPNSMKLAQFVSYAAWLKQVPRAAIADRVAEVLAQVSLSDAAEKPLGNLSGGMLRRAGLACAIVHRPAALVLDEPTAGLDPVQRDEFHSLIKGLAADSSILLATHLLEDVIALASRIVVLDHGRTIWTGDCADLARAKHSDAAVGVESLRAGFLAIVGAESP